MDIAIYNRKEKKIQYEKSFGGTALHFLYETTPGRLFLQPFLLKNFTKLYGRLNRTRYSAKKIAPFIERYQINMDDFEAQTYNSFQDFFIRKIACGKRPISSNPNDLIAVADGKLSCYQIDEERKIKIKNAIYTVGELLGDEPAAQYYRNGICLIFRLTVDDCHRYCFPDNGFVKTSKSICGTLHTVHPISQKKFKTFVKNSRICSRLETEHFGTVMQIEVGAILVGSIMNYPILHFQKGQEKGYFQPGGSTIVLLLRENTVKIDEDIESFSKQGIETKVQMGEKIGEAP